MSYKQKLEKEAKKKNTILCFGLDPVIENFPKEIKGSNEKKIISFYSSIIEKAEKSNAPIASLKPNYAFFAQYGFEGLKALKKLIEKFKPKYTIILDAKRGDIGKTASAYAKEGYVFYGADAITLSPLMGKDSIEPYFEYFGKEKGAYLLCRTSNPSANDFLTQQMHGGEPLYSLILKKALSWHQESLGVVVGATNIVDLKQILKQISDSKSKIPLLMPGIGTQGGSAKEVMGALRQYPSLLPIARINASSSISYAYKRAGGNFAEAAVVEIQKLNQSLKLE